jgi:hypothetical protein
MTPRIVVDSLSCQIIASIATLSLCESASVDDMHFVFLKTFKKQKRAPISGMPM